MRVNPLALVVLIPLIEIASCIAVGQAIGLGPTLLLLILGAVVGVVLIRAQGQGALRDLALFAEHRRLPQASLAIRLRLAIAGALLIVPGFVSDLAALILLLLPRKISLSRPQRAAPTIIDADYQIVESAPEKPARVELPDDRSPWGKGGRHER